MLKRWKAASRQLKTEAVMLYIAMRDPRTPHLARFLALGVVAYALSPVDLIPDFIPVLGALDDLILLPLGIALVLRLMPPAVMQSAREQATTAVNDPQLARTATILTLITWTVTVLLIAALVLA